MPWVPGTQFSTYEIESRLAIGGMAEVWRANMKGVEGFEKRVWAGADPARPGAIKGQTVPQEIIASLSDPTGATTIKAC